jgi:hypothetical protein
MRPCQRACSKRAMQREKDSRPSAIEDRSGEGIRKG